MAQSKKSLLVIFGGNSSEHEVSRMSVTSVLQNLDSEKYDISVLGITKCGKWLLYEGEHDKILDGAWEQESTCTPAFISPDKSVQSLVILREGGTEQRHIDVIFPVLHGKNGEDGTIQGLFQLSGVPFVGCDAYSSAVCMDKATTHSLLNAANIDQACYLWFYSNRYDAEPEKIRNKIVARLSFPVFVKPANAGSSVGVSRVNEPSELDAAIKLAAKEDKKILVEEGISGKEIECAVLGNRATAEASCVGEIAASAEFYDYDDKYINGTSENIIPASISDELAETVRTTAVRAFRLLGCSGLSRVDFFVTDDGRVLLNEINTLPGFTKISMYPQLWIHMGLTYSQLLDKLIELAFENK